MPPEIEIGHEYVIATGNRLPVLRTRISIWITLRGRTTLALVESITQP